MTLLLRATLLVAVLLLAAWPPRPAYAQLNVQSPGVTKGEWEVETHSTFQTGLPRTDADDGPPVRQGHELEIGYGVTDFWQFELGMTAQRPVDGSFEASGIEFENTFELGTIPRWSATFALFATLALGVGGADDPDAAELGPIVQFGDDKSGSLILNGFFEKTFGENRDKGLGFEYAAQLRLPLAGKFALGAELFGEIEDIDNAPSFEDTELRAGPMLYLSFGDDDDKAKGKPGDDDKDKSLKSGGKDPEIEIGAGVLLGATDATPDYTFKCDFEITF
ncbi:MULTISPECIES: hypothetical protein [Rhodomicrobium]|uniref:hypothetical protein n=1 Tax=Rhodomicrobium TaxID=1068 RepID=UPI000F743F18|nr:MULTISPECIES: hypothetical protein [Rhodomicrobium]